MKENKECIKQHLKQAQQMLVSRYQKTFIPTVLLFLLIQ